MLPFEVAQSQVRGEEEERSQVLQKKYIQTHRKYNRKREISPW